MKASEGVTAKGSGRTLTKKSKLADVIRDDGRAVYVIAGLAGIREYLISDYYSLRRTIPPRHVDKLCTVLECDPEDILEDL